MILFTTIGCSKNDNVDDNSSNNQEYLVQTCQVIEYNGNYENKYSGVIEATEIIPLSFPQNGNIEKIYVNEGDKVTKGQLLAELNKTYAVNMHEIALLKQKQAQDAYDRLLPMYENGTLPEIKLIEVQTGLNQANSSLQITQKGIQDCYLYAPTDGVIGKKEFQPGMNVLPTISVFDLYQIDKINVKIEVPENEINKISKGDTAHIYISAIDKSFIGTVSEIGIAADLLSHTYSVFVELSNPEHIIKPGMVASVTLNGKNDSQGYLVPNKALTNNQSGQSVFLVENNKAKEIPVETISLLDNKVLISGDLKTGDQVIYSGQQKINNGSIVNIIQ